MVGSLQQSFPAAIPGGYVEIQKSGSATSSVLDLINKAGVGAASTIVPQLLQRAEEIQPGLAEDDFIDLLKNQKVEGDKMYLARNEATGKIEIKSKPPQSYVSGTSPDGTDKQFGSEQSAMASFTPSSGYNNLLGLLTLRTTEPKRTANNRAKENEQRAEEQREKDRLNAIAENLKAHAQLLKAEQEEKRSLLEAHQARVEEQKAQSELNGAKNAERLAKEQMQKAETALAKADAHHNKNAEKKAELQKHLAQLAMERAEKESQLAQSTKERAEAEQRLSQVDQKKALADLKAEEVDKNLAALDLRLAEAKPASKETVEHKTTTKDADHGIPTHPMPTTVNVPGSNVTSQPDGMTSASDSISKTDERKRASAKHLFSATDDRTSDSIPIVQNYNWN
jgi:hypothetical protein